ncbi:hypothetical protein ACIRVF_30760 [Kitasatospora sp. NPDC101157]|uniref:hypothetical protein n=1 Tax=Kitasatospora sp. NPDC101157 TaxID=3364098 RepID=UPI0038304FF3
MSEIAFEYPAHITRQTDDGTPLVFFAAPATEIESWVGIPQRSRLADEETIGFQREESRPRIREISSFYRDERNVVQNPLLAAPQSDSAATFVPLDGHSEFGVIRITSEDFSGKSLLDLMTRVVQRLEARVPDLKETQLDPEKLAAISRRAREEHDFYGGLDEDLEGEDDVSVSPAGDNSDAASVLLTDETHLIDFYTELRGRINVLKVMDPGTIPDEFIGFGREAMLSYLKPIMLVDGQHRLKGAVLAAEQKANGPEGEEFLLNAVEDGLDADQAKERYLTANARRLPVSLLLNPSPSEHVFQFVVVNQKATPMGKALLGTIVSTSLSREELEPVAQRLQNAGIKLDDSQAVAYLTRHDSSPFKGWVQTGMAGDQKGYLQWNVLKDLVSIFRQLSGGKLFGQRNDYADVWKKKLLGESAFVSDFETFEEKAAAWAQPDGPWRSVFIAFYTRIRDEFGSGDLEAHNAWGSTQSNLFNKISLTILAADYFEYLTTLKQTLNSLDDVHTTITEWLEGVNRTYFDRDWRMEGRGIKKDTPVIRRTWASLWSEYRKNPESLPKVTSYNPAAKA